MQRQIVNLTILVMLGTLCFTRPAAAQEMRHYRGYFAGPTVEVPLQGFFYRAQLDTIQPAFYYRYRTQAFPLTGIGENQRLGRHTGYSASGVGQQSSAVLFSPVPLPGQYWYEEPERYSFSPKCDLRRPYLTRH